MSKRQDDFTYTIGTDDDADYYRNAKPVRTDYDALQDTYGPQTHIKPATWTEVVTTTVRTRTTTTVRTVREQVAVETTTQRGREG